MEELTSKTPRKLKSNFFRVDNIIFDYIRDTPGRANVLAVYFYLARKVDNNTQVCYPSQETIAEAIGLSRASVNRSVQTLLKRSIIAVSALNGRHNTYLLLDRSQWAKHEANVTKRYRPRTSLLHGYVAGGYTIKTPNQDSQNKTHFLNHSDGKKGQLATSNAGP